MHKSSPLFPPWMLLLLVVTAIAGLYLLFPGIQIIDKFKGQPVDETSIHYMQALLESQPNDIKLRTQLARELFKTQRTYEAMNTLLPVVDDSSTPIQTRLLNIEISFHQYFAIQTFDEKKTLEKRLRINIENLFPQLKTLESLAKLAQWSSELGWPRLSSDIYRTLMKLLSNQDNLIDRAVAWFSDTPYIKTKNPRSPVNYATDHLNALLAADAGIEALNQTKEYVSTFSEAADAEKLLKLARKIALSQGDIRQARNWSRLIISRFDNSSTAISYQIALEKNADDAENSLLWVQSMLQQYPDLQSVLYFGCELANALGKNSLAKQWGQQLLSLNPNDSLLLGQQIQSELHMGNVEAALSFALRTVELNPNNLKARKRLAQIARWAGDTETSMLQWQWLYENTGDEAALTQTLELSQGFFRADITVELLDSVGKRKPLDQPQLDTWFQALEASGLEDAGEMHLTTYLLRWPKQEPAWQYLRQAQHQNGHLQAAISTLQTMEQHFGVNSEHRIKQIQYWLLLGEPEKAWIIAQNTRTAINTDDITFWRYYGKLALLLGKERALANSYQILLQAGAANREEINWLLGFDENRDEDIFTKLALSAWRKLGFPDFLLDAVMFQIDKMNWDKARELMQLGEEKSGEFEVIPRYWTAKSRLAQNLGKQALAKLYLTRALTLSPDSIDIKATLLWFLVDSGDAKQLQKMLNTQQSLAEQLPVFWEPMAAGYRYLHQPARALFWYQKLIQQQPDNYLLLLAYADTLDAVGGKKAARLIRRDTLAKIRPRQELQLTEQSAAVTLDLRRQYAWLIRDHLGTEAGNRWLKWLNQQNTLTSAVYEEYRIAWYLARNRDQQARYHLLHTQNRNLQLPAWQKLAVALKNNELEKVDQVLQQTHDLTPSDRVTGYRAINQESKALLVALQHLNPRIKKSELQLLRQQASDLSLRNPSGFAISAENRNISNLQLSTIKFETAMSRNNHIFNFNYQSIGLQSANKHHLRLGKDQAMETLLSFHWHHRGLRSESWLKPSLSLRDDQNLLGITGDYQYTLWNGGLLQLGLAWNEISQESAAFRVQGARDRFTVGISSELSKREFFALKVHARHYKTRSGQSIGTGFEMGFNADYRIRFANPGWNVSLHGTWHQADINRHRRIPREFARLLPRSARIMNVISQSYREIGIKTHLIRGEMKPFGFVDRQFRYALEAGVFYAMPPNDLGYHVSANLAIRLFGRDELGFYSHYSDAQGGVNTRATMDIGVRYSHRF